MRVYLPGGKDWRDLVREMMSRARLVVVSLGMSAGTIWELTEAMVTVPPERLLLVVPMRRPEYEQFRDKAMAELRARAGQLRRDTGKVWFPPNLPDYPQGSREMHEGIKILIYFLSSWEPVVAQLANARFSFHDTLTLPLWIGLYPIFENLATCEGYSHQDHKTLGNTLLLRAEFIRKVVIATCSALLVSCTFKLAFGRQTEFLTTLLSLPSLVQLLLAFSIPWLSYLGRALRFKAEYHITFPKSPGDEGSDSPQAR